MNVNENGRLTLEYEKWSNFKKVIDKSKTSCEASNEAVFNHFADVGKMVSLGSSLNHFVDINKMIENSKARWSPLEAMQNGKCPVLLPFKITFF